MEPDPSQSQTPISPLEGTGAYRPYYVIAPNMAFHVGDEAGFSGYQVVLASARDEYEACDRARNALEKGVVPVAAFARADLLAMLGTLAQHPPLPPGAASYNLDHGKTGEEMAALREED